MSDFFILDKDKNVIPVKDCLEWAAWFEISKNRLLKKEKVGDYRVSTIFLGVEHNFGAAGPPLIFETMVFHGDGYSEVYMDRYSTYEQALAGHNKAVEWVKNGCKWEDI